MAADQRRAGGMKARLVLLVVLLAGLPLWWPAVPPLVDLPGHMGRYAVQLQAGQSGGLARWFDFEWRWIGNLGVDLLVQVLGPLLGVETATKLVVIAIPMLNVAGFLVVAREVHGRVPETAFLALPLAWSFPFLWGFVNFALSMALGFLAFALWLRLGRGGRLRLRFTLFTALSLILWTAHIYGWALLCVLAGCAELLRCRVFGPHWAKGLGQASLNLLSLLPPLILMARTFGAGGAGGQPFAHSWFRFDLKQRWVAAILRDRWEVYDTLSLTLLCAVVGVALIRWAVRRGPASGLPLILAAAVLWGLFVVLPHSLLGSAYADMRLAPYALATTLLAIGPMPVSIARPVRAASLGFFILRLGGTAYSFALYDQSYRAELAALDHLPRGARVVALVGKPCTLSWAAHRLDHLPSMGMVRRDAFVNDQWQAAGAQLLTVRYRGAAPFIADPSQFVVTPRCERHERRAFPKAVALLPRTGFDYLWIIQKPPAQADLSGFQLVWKKGNSALYRVIRTK